MAIWPLTMQVQRAKRLLAHPKFDGSVNNGFDIALLELSEPVMNTVVPTIHVKTVYGHNTRVTALGWGIYDPGVHDDFDLKTPTTLRMATQLHIVAHESCPKGLKELLKPHMICVYSKLQNICKGEHIISTYI